MSCHITSRHVTSRHVMSCSISLSTLARGLRGKLPGVQRVAEPLEVAQVPPLHLRDRGGVRPAGPPGLLASFFVGTRHFLVAFVYLVYGCCLVCLIVFMCCLFCLLYCVCLLSYMWLWLFCLVVYVCDRRNASLARMEGWIEKGGMKFQSPSVRNEYDYNVFVSYPPPLFDNPPFCFGDMSNSDFNNLFVQCVLCIQACHSRPPRVSSPRTLGDNLEFPKLGLLGPLVTTTILYRLAASFYTP